MDRYFIKQGYRENENPREYRDSLENAQTYQVDVYRHAEVLASSSDVHSVLDIGCGLATKLIEFISPHCDDITGIDCPETIEQCRSMHGAGSWIAGDIESPSFRVDGTFDLIISADVIEHLREPDRLLQLIRKASHAATLVVLSTPERDLRRGEQDMGPPANRAHVREWNAQELATYLTSRGFVIGERRIVELREGMRTCQLVVGGFGRGVSSDSS